MSTKSVLVHAPQGCGKTTQTPATAKALGLSTIHDNWEPGAAVALLDTLVLTNARVTNGHFRGRTMTFDQAMQVVQHGGDTA